MSRDSRFSFSPATPGPLLIAAWLALGLFANYKQAGFVIAPLLVAGIILLRGHRRLDRRLLSRGLGVILAFVAYQTGVLFRINFPVSHDRSVDLAPVGLSLVLAVALPVAGRGKAPYPPGLFRTGLMVLVGMLVILVLIILPLLPTYPSNLLLDEFPKLFARVAEAVLLTIVGLSVGDCLLAGALFKRDHQPTTRRSPARAAATRRRS